MTRKKKREEAETTAAVAGFGDPAPGTVATPARITPVDIQQKMFGKPSAMHRGYDEREVDQFLDDVTEELARQITESKSLREQLQRAEMRPTTPLGSEAADADALLQQARAEAARILSEARDDAGHVVAEARGEAIAILEAARGEAGSSGGSAAPAGMLGSVAPDKEFIHREREFLQSLAGLIQGHAEAIREDLKRVRGTADADAPDASAPDASATEASAPDGDAGSGPVEAEERGGADAAAESAATAEPEAAAAATGATAAASDIEAEPPVAEAADTAEAPSSSDAPPSTGEAPESAEAPAVAVAAAVVVAGATDPRDGTDTPTAAPADQPSDPADAAEPLVASQPPPDPDAGDEHAVQAVASEAAGETEADGSDPSSLLDLTSAEDDEEEAEAGISAAASADDDDPDGARDGHAQPAASEDDAEPVAAASEGTSPPDADDPSVGTPAAVGARSEPTAAPALAEAATGGRDVPASGSFGRWMEEGARPSVQVDEEDEQDRRSLRELFWGDE